MIRFEKFVLNNGLRVIVNTDETTPMVSMNLLYNVGAKDEDENKTGFAHLFEHLMFGGSVNIPSYDEPLENAGGDNNAFTNNDFTDYYLTIPKQNIETAFWLESDRMLNLAFSEKSLEVQRNVVIEEYKQRYLNKPYGDVWLLLRPLAYKVHPYRWPTIGQDISHIENATMDDVKKFFGNYYNPQNAILSLSGNISDGEAKTLSEKWFEPVPSKPVSRKIIQPEPVQQEKRILHVEKKVPASRIYKAYHCCARTDEDFYASDLLSDILSRGKSARLYQSLVKEKKLFTDVNAFLTGDLGKSLMIVEGKLISGVEMAAAENSIDEELSRIKNECVTEKELEKAKNMIESTIVFSEISTSTRAMNLAYFELLGNASAINTQAACYRPVTAEQIRKCANEIFSDQNCSVLYYTAKNQN